MFQEYCRRLGIGTSEHEIKHLVSVLKVLPRQHPLAIVLDGSRDSQNADALADALLNPRERCYSVPQLFDFIDRNGLTFGRWYLQAPYLSRCGAMALTPHAARVAAMPERDHYAAMELWRGTMTCHSVIVYGSDGAEGCRSVCFDGENWLRYVPIRLPSTLGVRERLPAGAAAVLLNRGHAYHDLILPITPQEEQLVDAIDGRRSIAEILDKARFSPGARAEAFFEKLWSFDQIVIDSSHA
jgi:hypothetical protein